MNPRREALASQQRGDVAVLRGTARVKRLRHRPEHFPQAGRLRRSEADRPDHFLHRQVEQPADRGRRAKHARGAGDVPAGVVVRRVDRVGHA